MATENLSGNSITGVVMQRVGGVMAIPTLVAVILGVGFMVALGKSRELKEGEPPLLEPRIPFAGHLIGMLRWQVGYMQMLSSKVPSYSAFTLRVFSSRIYVICDPSLIQAAYRNTKTFDFGSFVVESSQRAFDIGEQGMKIIRGENAPDYDPKGPFLNGNNGDSFLNENHKVMVEALTPGAGLSELSVGVLENVAASLDAIDEGEHKFGLHQWIRDVITLATADALYGPESPLNHDHSLIDSLWDFEANMTTLMLNLLPTVLAPKAYHGRAAIKKAFIKYYESGFDRQASSLVKSRLTNSRKWGFTADDIANFEISTLFLATTNSVPTSFWQLSYILADPSLFSSIRKEVESIVSYKNSSSGHQEGVIDTSLFQIRTPLLLSTFHETLRVIDAATSVRSVTAPTILSSATSNQSFHLQSPAIIQLPSGITHTSTKIWGSDALSFNPARFLPSTKASLSKPQQRLQAQGYFPFGGGKHLCPGRHLAMMEILAVVAGIVLVFDVEGLDKVPEKAFQKLGTAVRKPVKDVEVVMRRREGWKDVGIRFEIGGDKVDFGSMARDGEGEE